MCVQLRDAKWYTRIHSSAWLQMIPLGMQEGNVDMITNCGLRGATTNTPKVSNKIENFDKPLRGLYRTCLRESNIPSTSLNHIKQTFRPHIPWWFNRWLTAPVNRQFIMNSIDLSTIVKVSSPIRLLSHHNSNDNHQLSRRLIHHISNWPFPMSHNGSIPMMNNYHWPPLAIMTHG